MASGAGVFGDAARAADNSLKNTIMIEEELVTKSRKVSAGRFRERCVEIDRMNAVNVCRLAEGNDSSVGSIGEYHHLHTCKPHSLCKLGRAYLT